MGSEMCIRDRARYQRDMAAYRAMRRQGSDGPSMLPRLPSLSKRANKSSLPPAPAAGPPEELAESSSEGRPRARSYPGALEPPQPIASETMRDEHGAAIPVARRDTSRHVLPRGPRDALEGACVSPRKARTTPPLPSSNLLPGLSIGAAVHEPQRPAGRERMPSLLKKASEGALPEASSSMAPHLLPEGSIRESGRESQQESQRASWGGGEEIPPPDAPHVMVWPECQRRVSGLL